MNVWGDECLNSVREWWMSEVMDVWFYVGGDECLRWWMSEQDNSKLGSTQQWMTLTCCQDHILTENICHAMPLRQPWAISWERVETPEKKKPKHLAMDWAQHYPMYTWQEPKLQFNAICSVGKSWRMQHICNICKDCIIFRQYAQQNGDMVSSSWDLLNCYCKPH